MKLSSQRLDVLESLGQFLGMDIKTPEICPREITNPQLVAWEKACTNPEGFRQLKDDKACHVNKELPLNTKGNRGTVLRYPQWMREYKTGRGVYNLRLMLVQYNETLEVLRNEPSRRNENPKALEPTVS